MRCQACRRPLTNPISLRHKLGPDCLRKAVKAGNAPLEALTQLTEWKRTKAATQKAKPVITFENHSLDLFAKLQEQTIQLLNAAAEDCRAVGLTVTIEIK